MDVTSFKRVPRHIGFIPDGNRRWAELRGLPKAAGYEAGIEPGLRLMQSCVEIGVQEVSIYGFTQENVRRPKEQTEAFRDACIQFAQGALELGASLLVVGDSKSKVFPEVLKPYTQRSQGTANIKVNLLCNYGWAWDLQTALRAASSNGASAGPIEKYLASKEVSRMELVIRWGGRRRLSGFLPIQSVYSDIYVVDELWPDYQSEHFISAIEWYQEQDVTLGG